MLTRNGLLKSGNLMKYWKQERRDLYMNHQPVCSHSTRTDLLLMTMIWTLTMFDTSEKLITEQSDEIYGVNTIEWGDSAWKHLSLVGDEDVIRVLACEGLRIFRFCVMLWKDESETNIKFCLGRKIEFQRFITTQNFGHN